MDRVRGLLGAVARMEMEEAVEMEMRCVIRRALERSSFARATRRAAVRCRLLETSWSRDRAMDVRQSVLRSRRQPWSHLGRFS